MNITPIEFIQSLKEGKTERELNEKSNKTIDESELCFLIKRYDHTVESAKEHLLTDYSNGFTICKKCGSFYQLGEGFTKHLSNGCLHCEGVENHRVYHVEASPIRYGGFPARWMSQMFDDGMSYCKDKLQIEKYKKEVEQF
jgi:hypothetical protein